jgi:hypothetical protein
VHNRRACEGVGNIENGAWSHSARFFSLWHSRHRVGNCIGWPIPWRHPCTHLLNLELLAKRRSELWILLKDDIGVVHKGGQRQVVTRSDVQVVTVGGGQNPPVPQPGKPNPRILHIVDEHDATGLRGLYIRLPDSAFAAYGDLLPECESRGVVWAGNKITYVASDAVSASFNTKSASTKSSPLISMA